MLIREDFHKGRMFGNIRALYVISRNCLILFFLVPCISKSLKVLALVSARMVLMVMMLVWRRKDATAVVSSGA